jgi:hypothetical protein
MDNDHLPIDDRFTGYGESADNLGKAFGPIQPVAGVNFRPATVEVHLKPIAVVLDFVKPLLAIRRSTLRAGAK